MRERGRFRSNGLDSHRGGRHPRDHILAGGAGGGLCHPGSSHALQSRHGLVERTCARQETDLLYWLLTPICVRVCRIWMLAAGVAILFGDVSPGFADRAEPPALAAMRACLLIQ